MRHAALITAYKDFESLVSLLDRLRQMNVIAFVHVDRRARYSPSQVSVIEDKCVFLIQKFTVFWGSYSHLESIRYLAKIASKHPDIGFIHILSGQDYPVRDLTAFDTTKIYMLTEAIDSTIPVVRERFQYRKVAHRLERYQWAFGLLDRTLRRIQKYLGIKRTYSYTFYKIHKGLVWISLPCSAINYVFFSDVAKRFFEELRSYYLPEEFFFQTVLMNSSLKPLIVNDNLRYADWSRRDGHQPAILDETDAESIRVSGAVFARKFDSIISRTLLEIIKCDYSRL